MGTAGSVDSGKINLASFKTFCGDSFHEEVFDALKEGDEVSKEKMKELVIFVDRVARYEEVFLYYGLNTFTH